HPVCVRAAQAAHSRAAGRARALARRARPEPDRGAPLMTRTINTLLLGATLVLAACEAQPKTEPKDTPTPAATPIEEPPPSEPAVLSGVGPSGAEGRDARRQAALDLLTDGQTAAALPIDATDPDQKFDPRLAEKMAPKVRLSDVPSSSS